MLPILAYVHKYFLETGWTLREKSKRIEKEMRRDGQEEDQVTAKIQVQMEKDGTTPELNKNKWEFKIRGWLTATGSTHLFLPWLGPPLQSENTAYKDDTAYKDVHYKMLTVFISLYLHKMSLHKIVTHKVLQHPNPSNQQSIPKLLNIICNADPNIIFHLCFSYR